MYLQLHASFADAPKSRESVVSPLPVKGSTIVRLNDPAPPSVGRRLAKQEPSSSAVITIRCTYGVKSRA